MKGQSAYFASLNRDKESIALDLKKDEDRAVLLDLVRRGDVLVENYRPGTLDRLGLGYDRLKDLNPRLIYAAVSGFGHTGPWSPKPAYDMIVQAMSGLMSLTGEPGGPAMKAGTSIGDITGGMFTALGVASALYHREKTGAGMKVDVSMLDGQIAILESAVVRCTSTGSRRGGSAIGTRARALRAIRDGRSPAHRGGGNDAMFDVYVRHWVCRSCRATGVSRAIAAECRTDALQTALEAVLKTRPASEWQTRLEAAGVPCSLIFTVADAVEHDQVHARNMIVHAGDLRVAGNPIKLSAFPDPATRRPAPELDADGKDIRRELSRDD